jgi:hypothetical protein
MIIIYEADGLNNYIFITQPYEKCKGSSYTSARRATHKILFIIGGRRRTTDMTHVHGVDDGHGYGVFGESNCDLGMYGQSNSGYAAWPDGKVNIRRPLFKPEGSFKIDHPLDPANKYLSHSFVESSDMKNVYDGVVVLDHKGEAEIHFSDWFGALNKDFRYQLTAIGAPGPNLYIAEEISDATTTINYSSSSSSIDNNNDNNNSRFKIAGGTSGIKVSWQVTGIRRDLWANANLIEVEEEKPTNERGYYLHPDLYGHPEENGISHILFPKEKHELLINENKPSNL